MAGPWEQYQSSPASASSAPADGPWAQYGGQSGGEHGYAYAPAEEKPPATTPPVADPSGGSFGPDGSYVPPQAVPNANTPKTPYSSILPIFPGGHTGGGLGDPGTLSGDVVEGWQGGPRIIPQEQIDKANQYPLGYWVTSPLMQMVNAPLRAGNALFRGVQSVAANIAEPVGKAVPGIGGPGLGRDVAALPEAFPTGDYGQPAEPGTALQARNALYRTTPQVPLVPQAVTDAITSPFSARRPISLQEITDAIKQSEIQQNRLMPGAAPPPSGPVPQPTASQEPPAQPAPDFVPPGSPIARVRPAEIPPTGARSVDEQGVATPIQPPPDRLAPGAQPQSGAAAASTDGWRPVGPQEVFPGGMRFRMNTTTGQSEVYDPQPAGGGAAGADVTRQPIPPMTATQTQDAFEKSVLQTAEDRTTPGPNNTKVDETQYVPNAVRTDSARIFSPDNSVTDRVLKDTDPQGYGASALKVENDAKDTIFDNYKAQAGNKDAVDVAVQARDAFSPDQLGVFENQRPTSRGQNIVDYFNRLLDSPEGQRSNVAGILKDARDGFLDKNDNPQTMPSMLYGGRKNLTDILNEGLGSSTSARKASVQAARKFLTDALENHVDPAINDGAPLFDTFRTQWSALSKPIDRMNFLQEHLFGPGDVRGTDGKIYFQGVQNLLEKMAKLRRAVGNNPAKSFDLEHLDQLVAIRNELAAWHLRDRLFNAAGSPTVQRATKAAQLQSGLLGKAIAGAADLGGMALAGHVGGDLGYMAYHTTGAPMVRKLVQYPAARQLERTKAQMLNTVPRNLLGP